MSLLTSRKGQMFKNGKSMCLSFPRVVLGVGALTVAKTQLTFPCKHLHSGPDEVCVGKVIIHV